MTMDEETRARAREEQDEEKDPKIQVHEEVGGWLDQVVELFRKNLAEGEVLHHAMLVVWTEQPAPGGGLADMPATHRYDFGDLPEGFLVFGLSEIARQLTQRGLSKSRIFVPGGGTC